MICFQDRVVGDQDAMFLCVMLGAANINVGKLRTIGRKQLH